MALIHNVPEHSYHEVVSDTRTDSSMVSIACLVSECAVHVNTGTIVCFIVRHIFTDDLFCLYFYLLILFHHVIK